MKVAIRFTFTILVIIGILICLILWPVHTLISLGALLILIVFYDLIQKRHAILRNFPLIGHMRYILEDFGPEIRQYFVESNTDGRPVDRNQRGYIYERSKNLSETHPFGTELDVNAENYSWMQHSIYPSAVQEPLRVNIGGADCRQPYAASLFNISAMSYGSLSKNAIMALNKGAKAGGFYHNTGEGSISHYHQQGGDLVWEIGTGYFGCRDTEGNFSPEKFKENAAQTAVKMIEIKISQGAKPGHGGVLPAGKNNLEISKIRGTIPHTDVISPPGHSAFSDAKGLLHFVQQLRELSGGKPVGFKLCIGRKQEFLDICEQMVVTGILPDFITVDGSEGGTGAAPIDFSNYVGMPWENALVFVTDCLHHYDLRQDIKVITATKIFTSYDIFKALCIGADLCNSARGMMMALGCIQALKCDTNECPTGVATQNPALVRGLVVSEKWHRVYNYHRLNLEGFMELFAAAGCTQLSELNRSLICKKVGDEIKTYAELYPIPEKKHDQTTGAISV